MPVNGMNVGVDYTFIWFRGDTGAIVDIGDVQSVRIHGQKHDLKTMPYNNVPRFGYVPDGYRVEFVITRAVPTLEDYMVDYSAAFQASQIMLPGVLNEYIHNTDNSISRYQYTNCVMYLIDHGDISREKTIPIRLDGLASDKIRIS
jgi:hypothetical protein